MISLRAANVGSPVEPARRSPLRRALAIIGRAGRRAVVPPQIELDRPLTDCSECGEDHVCPVEWDEVDDAHWWIRLRCADCESCREVVLADEDAAELGRLLTAQVAMIDEAAGRL